MKKDIKWYAVGGIFHGNPPDLALRKRELLIPVNSKVIQDIKRIFGDMKRDGIRNAKEL